MNEMKEIELRSIVLDEDIQARYQLDMIVVGEYAAAMKDGAQFPPVVVFFDGSTYWLADGFHRVTAARDYAGLMVFPAELHHGTKRDAQWWALGANRDYGLRRNSADLKKIAQRIYFDPEWFGKGQSEIARHTMIPRQTLSRWFAEFASCSVGRSKPPATAQPTRSTRRTSVSGRLYRCPSPNRNRCRRGLLGRNQHRLSRLRCGADTLKITKQ